MFFLVFNANKRSVSKDDVENLLSRGVVA